MCRKLGQFLIRLRKMGRGDFGRFNEGLTRRGKLEGVLNVSLIYMFCKQTLISQRYINKEYYAVHFDDCLSSNRNKV